MSSILRVRDADGNIIDIPAIKGASAYEVAVSNGYEGTEEEWLESLKGSGTGEGLTEEQAADLAANTEARHTHDNKSTLDLFGINTAKTRPTFNNGLTEEVLAIQSDVTSRVNELRVTVPNAATVEGNTLKMQRKTGTEDVGTDLFSVELPETTVPTKTSELENDSGFITETEVDEIVEDVIAKMNEKTEIIITEQSGGYWSIRGVWDSVDSISSKYTNIVPVKEGEKYSYTGYGQYQGASVLWYSDTEGSTLLSYEQYYKDGEPDVAQTAVVTVPAGAKSARFCSYSYVAPVLSVARYEEKSKINVLLGKKIIYDGDSICESRTTSAANGGAYAKIIAETTSGMYVNQAVGGGKLTTRTDGGHSIVDNLPNLPTDGDLYCFEGGINDYWAEGINLGTCDLTNFDGELDTTTVCGALETIFRYCLNNFIGKPICFVIPHKIQKTAYRENTEGDTFKDYRDAMVNICEKYSIPYYDAFSESGLNGWNQAQSDAFLTASTDGTSDGCHPNEEAYKRYYVPQLMSLFEKIMPIE